MVLAHYRPVGGSAKQISQSLESEIASGALRPGDTLPSVRALAAQLGVAPGTVAAVYQQLRGRGLVETRGRNGTRVRPRPARAARSGVIRLDPDVCDLASGQPDPKLLPVIHSRASRSGNTAAAPDTPMVPELLALAGERFAADGIPATAMTVTAGGLDAIHRVLTAQLRPGDLVAVEDPGWPNVLDLVAALGLRPCPVALDTQGPRPEALRDALRAGARAVILTNRAQNPTGVFLTSQRAPELRAVLADYAQTMVIEDDHAAELADVELSSLSGATSSWALIRSTSKPYGPDLRVAFIAGDEATIARVEDRMRVSSGWVSTLLQHFVLDLWTSQAAAAVVSRAAMTYDVRRNQLVAELAERGIDSTGRTGLNVWVPVSDETKVVSTLMQRRWAVAAGARFRQASQPGIRITVSALNAASIPRLAAEIAAAVAINAPASYTT